MKNPPERWWDLPAAVFLFFAVLIAAWRLQATNWVEGLEHVRTVAAGGAILGLALGQSRFRRRGVILLSVGYMLLMFYWQWMSYAELPRDLPLLEKSGVLFGRLWVSLVEWASGRPVDDPLIFIAYLSIPYWVLGVYGGYQTTRHANALKALLPGVAVMFIIYLNHFTTTNFNWLFGAYFFVSLLLISRLRYLTNLREWTETRVQISGDSSIDLNNIAMVSAAILIVLAWATPTSIPSNAEIRQAWRDLNEAWFPEEEEQFTFINKEEAPRPTDAFIQKELALGTEISQSETILFLVNAPVTARDLPRLYWRGVVYDRFEDGEWKSSTPEQVEFRPVDGEFDAPRWEQRKFLSFSFNVYSTRQDVIYTPSQPLWVSRNASVLHAKTEPGVEDSTEMDVMIIQAAPSLKAGETYRVNAALANPAIADLQAAGTEYPAWVTDNYLQLPVDFSPRIQELAREITAPYETPYDKTAAITEYLRREITYTPQITLPEESTDPLEYFLFESKAGFCNYYASAQVLMLRSIGIPARLVVGFSQGEASLQNTLYTVRERNFHAWPEVYFPNYGWVEFEPTGNQDPLERQASREGAAVPTPTPLPVTLEAPLLDGGEEPDILPEEEVSQAEPILSREQVIQISSILGILIAITAVVLTKRRYAPTLTMTSAVRAVIERTGWQPPAWLNNWLEWNEISSIERAFQSVNLALRWMGRPQAVHITPAERASLLKTIVPEAAPQVDALLGELHAELFGPRGGNTSTARRAARMVLWNTLMARLKS